MIALNAFINSLFSRYAEILERKFSLLFEQIVSEDENQSMMVNDSEEFDRVAQVSWLPVDGAWSEEALREYVKHKLTNHT